VGCATLTTGCWGLLFAKIWGMIGTSQTTHTMKTFFVAILCLTVGTAYGHYFVDAVQAGSELIETARQS